MVISHIIKCLTTDGDSKIKVYFPLSKCATKRVVIDFPVDTFNLGLLVFRINTKHAGLDDIFLKFFFL